MCLALLDSSNNLEYSAMRSLCEASETPHKAQCAVGFDTLEVLSSILP